jgi:hypothetical protein
MGAGQLARTSSTHGSGGRREPLQESKRVKMRGSMTMSMQCGSWLVACAWRGLARRGLAHGRPGSLNELLVLERQGWEQWPPPAPSLLPAAADCHGAREVTRQTQLFGRLFETAHSMHCPFRTISPTRTCLEAGHKQVEASQRPSALGPSIEKALDTPFGITLPRPRRGQGDPLASLSAGHRQRKKLGGQ